MFFENTHCLTCGRTLAFAPDRMTMLTLSRHDDGLWRPVEGEPATSTQGAPAESGSAASADVAYRLCANYTDANVCNWAVRADRTDSLCRSCALTHTIPDLGIPENQAAWAKLEMAKRRLVYALLSLELPLITKSEDGRRGLEFQFLSDSIAPNGDRSRVLTGHDDGLITINVAEADDVYREAQRQHQNEPYRTVLGHFRHEIGHYYWDRLIAGSDRLEQFRGLFGDERADYQEALKRHYAQGAPANWDDNYISAYATMHPWEDWAESWAHVMHMVDALETAQAIGLSVKPARRDEPALSIPPKPPQGRVGDFDRLVHEWASLTYVLNNLTRGLGLADAYPFVISGSVLEKLRFVSQSMTRPA